MNAIDMQPSPLMDASVQVDNNGVACVSASVIDYGERVVSDDSAPCGLAGSDSEENKDGGVENLNNGCDHEDC